MALLKALAKLLTRDLTGRTWQKEAAHPYFSNLIYFGSKDPHACYWEAELPLPDGERIGVNMTGTPEGPTPDEERFCRTAVSDLDALFERCRTAFAEEYTKWTTQPFPIRWREGFKLDGFQVPVGGDPTNPWELCYFVQRANHYFTAIFERGRVTNVEVDG